jgi:YHS domain-containing protein
MFEPRGVLEMLATKRACLRMPRFAAALVLVIAAGSALAGEFYEKDGVAIKGYDPVAYFTDGKPVKGSPAYTAEYGRSVFHFASPAHRDAFVANPAQYIPQYQGFCAFGVARGYKAAIDPAAFTIVNNKLYLNYNNTVQKQWRADIPGFVAQADKNWPEVATQTRIIE